MLKMRLSQSSIEVSIKKSIQGQMIAKEPVLDIIQQQREDVNPFTMNPEELPENDEELSLYMQLHYKPAIEIAQEEAIDTLFDNNKYHDIKKTI